jgi:TonB family protein
MWKAMRTRSLLLRGLPALLVLMSVASLPGWGQDKGGATADNSVPSAQGPNNLMLFAAKQNGLLGDDVGPWHLKASFTELDEQGNAIDAIAYEELSVSPTKYKRVFTGKTFAQTEYGTEKGLFRSGAREAAPVLLEEAHSEFTNPLPSPGLVAKGSFDLKEIETNGIKIDCLRSKGLPVSADRTYCVGTDKPFLRITSSAPENEQILHNRILGFHERFIAGDLQFVVAGKRRLTAHLESIEPLGAVDNAMFTPPADSVSVPKEVNIPFVNVSAAVSTGMLLRKVAPAYPSFARREHISGTVVLQAMIGKDGHIQNLKVVSGPSELKVAALEAVHQWLYRPYLFNGQPVAVQTTINVIFALN